MCFFASDKITYMKFIIPAALLLIFFFQNCSSTLKVHTDSAKNLDFSQYKTFDFYEIKEEHLQMKEVNRRRLAMAIELELGYKGIKRNTNDPDLLVNLYSFLNSGERVTSTSGNNSGIGYYGAATPYGTGVGISISSPSSSSQYYSKGTVTFHLVDRKENKLISESLAKIDATDNDSAERIINYIVKRVYGDIPDKVKRR